MACLQANIQHTCDAADNRRPCAKYHEARQLLIPRQDATEVTADLADE
jgi:hypothetical protein